MFSGRELLCDGVAPAERGADGSGRAVLPFRAGGAAGGRSPGGRWIADPIRHGLQWKDAPRDYGPHEALHNPFSRGVAATLSGLRISSLCRTSACRK